MPITVYLAASAIVVSIPVLWWSLATSTHSNPLARPGLGEPIFGDRGSLAPTRSSSVWRVVGSLPIAKSVRELEKRIAQAGLGSRWRIERVLAIKFVLAGATLVIGLTRIASSFSTNGAVITAAAALGLYLLPDLLISSKARDRQLRIEQQLPDLLDQLTISVEAGLGLDSSLARVAQRGRGPIFDEVRWVLQDIQLGLPRDVALAGLADRTTVIDLRSLVTSVTQSSKYGLALADVMRALADDAREKRRLRAQERAFTVPVKLVVPLILFILPCLLIVLLGPAVIRTQNTSLFK